MVETMSAQAAALVELVVGQTLEIQLEIKALVEVVLEDTLGMVAMEEIQKARGILKEPLAKVVVLEVVLDQDQTASLVQEEALDYLVRELAEQEDSI
jgi:hypothetical protein